jgi:hypothetical protein
MLQIDRVKSDIEIVPGDEPPAAANSGASVDVLLRMLERDPSSRMRLRSLVLDVLREELQELERRGRV